MLSSISSLSSKTGTFYGVGVGPGDPELITLKAARLIEHADVIAYLSNAQGRSQSRDIAQIILAQTTKNQIEMPIQMPMADDPKVGNHVYDQASLVLEDYLKQGLSVVFLCEGDPLFYGSFAYLLERMQSAGESGYSCITVPGISSPHAASSALNLPLTMMKESFSVVSGRHDDVMIENTLIKFDSVIIMKAGRSRPRLLALLKKTQRSADAHYLEYIGRENERIVSDIAVLDTDEAGPYFSLFVVSRKGERRL